MAKVRQSIRRHLCIRVIQEWFCQFTHHLYMTNYRTSTLQIDVSSKTTALTRKNSNVDSRGDSDSRAHNVKEATWAIEWLWSLNPNLKMASKGPWSEHHPAWAACRWEELEKQGLRTGYPVFSHPFPFTSFIFLSLIFSRLYSPQNTVLFNNYYLMVYQTRTS